MIQTYQNENVMEMWHKCIDVLEHPFDVIASTSCNVAFDRNIPNCMYPTHNNANNIVPPTDIEDPIDLVTPHTTYIVW